MTSQEGQETPKVLDSVLIDDPDLLSKARLIYDQFVRSDAPTALTCLSVSTRADVLARIESGSLTPTLFDKASFDLKDQLALEKLVDFSEWVKTRQGR